jgi:hypothetical protein
MKTLAGIAFALLACVATASAQPPLQQTAGSKIDVTQCYPHRHTAGQAHPWIDPYGVMRSPDDFPYYDGFLAISYKNEASVAATEVDFGLVARGSLIAVAKDAGTFSPDVMIDHEFVVSREIFPIGTAFPYCSVLRVKYADGSTWHNPNPPEP